MLVKDMMANYVATRAALTEKINLIKNVPETQIYDYINEMDDLNESLHLLNTTVYDIPVGAEDLVIIPNDGTITIPQMIENVGAFDAYSVNAFNYLKQVAAGNYQSFLNTLPALKERVDTTIQYQQDKVDFDDVDINTQGKVKLETPSLTLDAIGKTITWNAVNHADSYQLTYENSTGTVTPFTAVASEISGVFTLNISEITTPDTYVIHVLAKTNDTANYIDSDVANSDPYIVNAPAVKLTVDNFAIDQTGKKATWDVNANALSFTAKAKDYPLVGSDLPLIMSTVGGNVEADLSTLTAVGNWTIEVVAIGDGTVYTNSDPVTGVYAVAAPPTQLTLDASSIVVAGDKKSFTFDPCPETTDVTYEETTGIDVGDYTITVGASEITFEVTSNVEDGTFITPSIKVVPNDTVLYTESAVMAGPNIGNVKTMPVIANLMQNGADLEFEIAEMATTGQPDCEEIEFTLSMVPNPDETISVQVGDLVYDYDVDNTVKIVNFNDLLVTAGFAATDVVGISAINVGVDEWIESSIATTGTFTVE